MKKQKHKLMTKDISNMEPSRAAIFGLPGRVVNVEMSSDISECDIRVPENLIFRKTAVYVVWKIPLIGYGISESMSSNVSSKDTILVISVCAVEI
jgi:hypothetical protein